MGAIMKPNSERMAKTFLLSKMIYREMLSKDEQQELLDDQTEQLMKVDTAEDDLKLLMDKPSTSRS